MKIMKSRKMLIGLIVGICLLVGLAILAIVIGSRKDEGDDVPAGNPSVTKPDDDDTQVWLLDFSSYTGASTDANAYLKLDVTTGSTYTFSFDYCVVGDSMGTTVINAAKDWGLGSNVSLPDNQLIGKDSYSITFTADYPYFIPVFQTHMPYGAPKLYVWNLSLVREGSDRNVLASLREDRFAGDLADADLVYLVDIDPDTLEGTAAEIPENPVWLYDFSGYKGSSTDPSAYITANVEVGSTYTFSFDYCVEGETYGTTVINAAKDWGLGSKVAFTNNQLNGKGAYTITFTADYPQVIPVFQSYTPYGTPKLYTWNISLVKEGTDKNLFEKLMVQSFKGELAKEKLVSVLDIDPATLKGTTVKTYKDPTWLFDFSKYTGAEKDPSAYMSLDVEVGKTYTFSFDYCVEGESYGTTVINAAKDWGMGSNVAFKNNKLNGKGTYTTTFTADYPKVIPVFQTHIPYGAPKLYVWNIKLVQAGDSTNKIGTMTAKSFKGELANAGLATVVNVDTNALKGTVTAIPVAPGGNDAYIGGKTWLFDFAGYSGEELNPSAYFCADVEVGSTYTFSFDYCIDGDTSGTSVINAAKDWGMGSNVAFTNNRLNGKSTYTVTFTADYPHVYPVFQTHTPYGAPKLYVWNMKLVKSGSGTNLLDAVPTSQFKGQLVNSKLVTVSNVNTDTLQPTSKPVTYIGGNTWLLDFAGYENETNTDPSVYFGMDVEKGANYTFSFKYCVVGESTGTNVINAAKDWGMGSNVDFKQKLTGKGEYTTTFTADYDKIYPVFQTHIPYGAPQLYIWDVTLVKEGTSDNMMASTPSNIFRGELFNAELVTISDVDTDTLEPSTGEEPEVPDNPDEPENNIKPVWLFDFNGYKGNTADISAYCSADVEKDEEYTFSFEYCVRGATTNTTVINAAKDWGMGSNVAFTDNKLTGKGTYTITFTADYEKVYPVFQTHVPHGAPELYVWDMKLVKTGSEENLLAEKTVDDFKGVLRTENLLSVSEIDPNTLEPSDSDNLEAIMKSVWKFDFAGYTGTTTDISAYCSAEVEVGEEYTFSFDYCVKGATTNTTVINAAKDWGMGSNVAFTDNKLTGKGTYTITFTADYAKVYPVFQTHVPHGAPELYVWDMKLIKTGSETNLLAEKTVDNFAGVLKNESLLSVSEMDINTLEPSNGEESIANMKSVWLFDFAKYTGSENDISGYCSADVEVGEEYTFSFEYCVKGATTNTTIVNAAKDWGMGSNVDFKQKLTGKGTYTITFTADYAKVYPVFQTHVPHGAPELYVWDMKLIKTGSETNLLAEKTVDNFAGVLKNESLLSVSEMDVNKMEPSGNE